MTKQFKKLLLILGVISNLIFVYLPNCFGALSVCTYEKSQVYTCDNPGADSGLRVHGQENGKSVLYHIAKDSSSDLKVYSGGVNQGIQVSGGTDTPIHIGSGTAMVPKTCGYEICTANRNGQECGVDCCGVAYPACAANFGCNTSTGTCIPVTSDINNCGSYGHVCRNGEICYGGKCVGTNNGAPVLSAEVVFMFKNPIVNALFGQYDYELRSTIINPGSGMAGGNMSIQFEYNALWKNYPYISPYPIVKNDGCQGNLQVKYQDIKGHWSAQKTVVIPAAPGSPTDPKNCGTACHVCPSGQMCSAGQCVVNTQTDPNNCGSAGHVCGSGQTCSAGQCVNVNTQTDPNNCGTLGNICSSGVCSVGKCINTQTDPNNCGTVGHFCPLSGQGGPDLVAIQQPCSGGKCIDIDNDPNNCGKVDRVCGSGQTCSGGQCITSCVPNCGGSGSCGRSDGCGGTCSGVCQQIAGFGCYKDSNTYSCRFATCNDITCPKTQICSNGKCINTQTDPYNCGALGNVCSNFYGTPVCSKGQCVSIDTQTDPNNCGKAGHVCSLVLIASGPVDGSPGVCSGGQCIDIANDSNNCGSVGNVCASGVRCNYGSCCGSVDDPNGGGRCYEPP